MPLLAYVSAIPVRYSANYFHSEFGIVADVRLSLRCHYFITLNILNNEKHNSNFGRLL